MTNPLYGPSLFQARKTDHVHRHSHLHNRKSDNIHARSHAEFHKRRDETADLDSRDSTITEVVQTISVVQIIDGSGATLSAQTVTGSSQTDLLDAETGSTIVVAFKDAATTSTDADADATTTASSVTAVSTADPVSVTSDSTASSTDSSIPSTTDTTSPPELSLTHISSSSSSAFSTLSSVSNSTTSSFTLSTPSSSIPSLLSSSIPPTNNSQSANSKYASSTYLQSFTSSSSTAPSASSTTLLSSILSSASSPLLSPTSTWTTGSSSTAWSSDSASATYSSEGSDGSGATTASAGTSSSTSTSASSASSSNGTSPQTSEVVGGIFGGIAGVALLVALAVMILRLKKRGWCHLRLGGDDDGPEVASRALPASGGGGDGSGAYGTMQRSAPQAVAASLAALAGKRTSRDRAGSGPEMAERGFVRVSGRKLPPVLQYGGDGYTDPRGNRNSQASEASASVYRDSIAVFDQPNHTRLALGSPMRPESGIMTVQPGPARVPVTNQAPGVNSPTLPRSSTFPSTDLLGRTLMSEGFSRDAIGRTLAAHDHSHDGAASRGSRGSHTSRGSGRFTEHVS